MQAATYSFPTLVDFGPGRLAGLPGHCKRYGKRVLVVTDPGVRALPIFTQLEDTLRQGGVEFEVFSGISPDPKDSEVHTGGDVYREAQCDLIVGFGGGSALDGAKGIALTGTHDGNVLDYDDAKGGWELIGEHIAPTICISTTAGTGSEVGRSTVVVNTATKTKVVVFSPYMMPKVAVLDPEIHVGMPAHLTAATGMDALTHNIEALLSKGYHPMADAIALGGIRLIAESLERAVQDGADIEARGAMALAAAMGATAFQKGLGVIHSLAHPCSTIAKVHHGLANGVLIETGMRFNRDVSETAMARIALEVGIRGDNDAVLADKAIEWVAQLRESVGIPGKLSAVGVDESMLSEMDHQAFLDGCHQSNPKAVSQDDIIRLYREAL